MMHQSAANNAYEWCATQFQHNPPGFAPPPMKPFPWFINGQLVPAPDF